MTQMSIGTFMDGCVTFMVTNEDALCEVNEEKSNLEEICSSEKVV